MKINDFFSTIAPGKERTSQSISSKVPPLSKTFLLTIIVLPNRSRTKFISMSSIQSLTGSKLRLMFFEVRTLTKIENLRLLRNRRNKKNDSNS